MLTRVPPPPTQSWFRTRVRCSSLAVSLPPTRVSPTALAALTPMRVSLPVSADVTSLKVRLLTRYITRTVWRGNTANVIRYFPTQALNLCVLNEVALCQQR